MSLDELRVKISDPTTDLSARKSFLSASANPTTDPQRLAQHRPNQTAQFNYCAQPPGHTPAHKTDADVRAKLDLTDPQNTMIYDRAQMTGQSLEGTTSCQLNPQANNSFFGAVCNIGNEIRRGISGPEQHAGIDPTLQVEAPAPGMLG